MTLLLPLLAAFVGVLTVPGTARIENATIGAPTGGSIVVSVAANGDDGQMTAAVYYNDGESADGVGWAGDVGGYPQYFFCRFTLSAAIPDNTTITNAVLKIYGRDAYLWSDGADDLRVLATDSADAAQVTDVAARPVECFSGSTVTTTAVVAWNNVTWSTSGLNTSPDLSTIIQELVDDNNGLAQNAHVLLWVSGIVGVGHYVGGELLEHAGSNPAELTIQW